MSASRPVTQFRAILLPLVLLCINLASHVPADAATLQGDINIHDPSMIKQGDSYYLFSTGDSRGLINQGNIQIRKSTDLIAWQFVGTVFPSTPEWFITALGLKPRSLWAPDVSYFNGKYYLYYAGSRFGTNNSVIGLAANITLDPTSPNYKWVDEGQVIRSTSSDNSSVAFLSQSITPRRREEREGFFVIAPRRREGREDSLNQTSRPSRLRGEL